MSHEDIFHEEMARKAHENSIRGVRTSWRQGNDSLDVDLQMDRLGIIYALHDGQPLRRGGFVDPLNRIPVDAWVRLMTPEQVSRLRHPVGNYRILRLPAILRECARLGIEAVLEPKGDSRFELDAPWEQVKRIRNHTGARISVRALRDLPTHNAGTRRIQAARRVMPRIEAWTI